MSAVRTGRLQDNAGSSVKLRLCELYDAELCSFSRYEAEFIVGLRETPWSSLTPEQRIRVHELYDTAIDRSALGVGCG